MKPTVVVAVGLLLLAGCGSAPDEQTAGLEGRQPEPAQPVAPAEPEPPDAVDQELAITFGGDTCQYDGPTTVAAGVQAVTLANTDRDRTLAVVLARFADGHTYDDFLEWMGPDRPYEVPPRIVPPEWLDGDWRPIQEVAPDTDVALDVSMVAGDHALICWLQGPPGNGHAWPVTPLSVTDEGDGT